MFWKYALAVVTFISVAGDAVAAPPTSCANKIAGTWQHGTSNVETLTRGGLAICSGNPFCQQGTWTCEGNSFVYTNSSGTFTYTLQPNGTMTLGSIVMTRISPAMHVPTVNARAPTVREPTVRTPAAPTVQSPTITISVPTTLKPTVNTPAVQ